MYSKEQKDIALRIYHQTESVTETIRILGYPTRRNLYTWIAEENTPSKTRKEYPVINNPPDHPRNPPLEVKLDAIHRCYELGENVKYVSEDIGYSRASIYQWRKRYLKEGTLGLMNHKNITPGTLVEGSVSSTDISSDEINQLKAQMQDMQLEIDILKETINVLKKDPDIDQSALSNREKAVIIDVLKNRYSLPLLLQKLQLSKSSYYYQEQSLQKEDKYTLLRVRVIELFTENKGRYGYRRIHALLKRENIIVSEKVIRRIMKEEQLVVKIKRTRKYNSYQGEISPAVDNLINRNFSASKPNEKWLTDITEFAIPAGKVYLSPIVDCFDGLVGRLSSVKDLNKYSKASGSTFERCCVNADTDGVFLLKSKKSSSSLLIVAPPEFIMIPIKVLKSIFRFREKSTLGFRRNKHGLLANSEI